MYFFPVAEDDGSQKEATRSTCIEMYFNVSNFNADLRSEVCFLVEIL